MSAKGHLFLPLLFLLSSLNTSYNFAQTFGKNHVQYKKFSARFIQSQHFDIYFHEGGEEIAEFTAELAEQNYQELKENFQYELSSRITIVVYNSHNDFEQTNINLAPPQESVGGFTEFLKNRVVIPYEGDWEKFRHVIHHELTHAVMLQMVYGSGVQAILTGLARLHLPLWFVEGMAEYQSREWDTESDMFMRDATINGYVPNIPHLNGFLAYKGGQAVLYYLSERYGHEKIGELLTKVKITKNLDRAMKQAVGLGIAGLSKRWQHHLKQQYWPDIAGRKNPAEIGKQLTDHIVFRNFINNSASLSPNGDQIAFLSDKSDYFDIYLMNAFDGKITTKLVSGQRSGNLEELHWLRPGISWSPDSKSIVFAAKSGAEDVLHIVDIKRRKIVRSLKFGLDGVFSPSWSPENNEIAFVGTKDGICDIYAVDLQTTNLRKVTDDVFSDLEPSYSPDGSKIVFVSDRGKHTDPTKISADFKIWQSDFRNLDIYTVTTRDTAGLRKIEQITDTPYSERSPVFSPQGDKLAFTSDRSGIYNIYLHDFVTREQYPITNILTGVFHLSWAGDGSKMSFVSFYNGGYDLFMLKRPHDIAPDAINLKKTAYLTKFEKNHGLQQSSILLASTETRPKDDSEKFRNYVFGRDFAKGKIIRKEEKIALHDSSQYKLTNGEYKIHDYKTKFTPDIVYGSAGYNQFFGVQGLTQISLSDILGNHRVDLYTDLFYNFRRSNFLVRYFHLPKRTDYGIGAFHNSWLFSSSSSGLIRDRYFGLNLFANRPFNSFKRIEGSIGWLAINREFEDLPNRPNRNLRVVLTSLSYVTDTALWGWTGPTNGGRNTFSISASPKLDKDSGLGFVTLRGDYRKYFKFMNEYNFVFRLAGGFSEGSEPQQFFLGGTNNWLNREFNGGIRIDRPEDIYFSSFEAPLRGTDYYEQTGNRFALMNMEFRFPLIRYLILGWPLPLGFQNIRGAAFTDIGGAWQGKFGKYEKFRPFKKLSSGRPALNNLLVGYGLGARANLGLLLLQFDMAWTADFYSTSSKPRYYFSLGTEL